MNASTRFCWQKGKVVLGILIAGLAVALDWSLRVMLDPAGRGLGTTLVGSSAGRFGDFTDPVSASVLPNPYVDPTTFYPPVDYVFFRFIDRSEWLSLVVIDFVSLTALALLLTHMLRTIVIAPWARVATAYLFLALSYPVLFCLDRGNIDILLVALCAWAAYLYTRRSDMAGSACLFPAICLKFYPALLLVLLLRRRKMGWLIGCIVGAIVVNYAAAFLWTAPASDLWSAYRQDIAFYRDAFLLDNKALAGSASPWNAYKISLLGLEHLGWIAPVDFSFSGAFIQASYRGYTLVMGLLATGCIVYAWLLEAKIARSILMLFLFLSIATPSGGDYRLMYASMALVILVILRRHRRGDWAALLLLALAVIPKKEIVLTFAGVTESGLADVPIQALLNPILILAAMTILYIMSRRQPRAAAQEEVACRKIERP